MNDSVTDFDFFLAAERNSITSLLEKNGLLTLNFSEATVTNFELNSGEASDRTYISCGPIENGTISGVHHQHMGEYVQPLTTLVFSPYELGKTAEQKRVLASMVAQFAQASIPFYVIGSTHSAQPHYSLAIVPEQQERFLLGEADDFLLESTYDYKTRELSL